MFRRPFRLRRAATVALLAFTVSSPVVAQPVIHVPAMTPPAERARLDRLADLIRLWNFSRFFHVDERAMTSQWERALEEAAEPALAAVDEAAFARVVDSMMAKLDTPAPGDAAVPADTPPAIDVPPFRLVEGEAVASCPAIASAVGRGQPVRAPDDMLPHIASRGLILDCRGFGTGPASGQYAFVFHQWFSTAAPALVSRPVDRGGIRERFHDGYPPDLGFTSGGYARGTADTSLGRIEPGPASRARAPLLVVIADATTPEPWTLAGGLSAAGQGKLVAQGRLSDRNLYAFNARHLRFPVMTASYVDPDGRVGFTPDSCVAADAPQAAMTAAAALLSRRLAPACSAPANASVETSSPTSVPAAAALGAGPEAPLPPLGQRIVALAKMWGLIEYFFPYKSLTDRNWSVALNLAVPDFVRADTRADYEDALLRLARHTDDSHVFVGGLRAHRLAQPAAPGIYVRPIESGFAVAGFHDPDLADQLRVGDEIIAVDGRPLQEMAPELRPFIAASTPQSLAHRLSGLLLNGAPDSVAKLTVRRGDQAPFDVSVPRFIQDGRHRRRPPSLEPAFRRIGSDIGYVDLERLTREQADPALDSLMDTKAIIFDLRGYPQGTAWLLAPRLALDGREGAIAARFRRPTYRGPSEAQENWTSFTQAIPTSDKPKYRGRIFVLIDERAISQSEHTALFFKAAADPLFVGTPTTGANGDVTQIALPGGLSLSITGHDVRHPDGAQLQRVGIQPDIVVAPTFAGLQAGRDEVLEAALAAARAN